MSTGLEAAAPSTVVRGRPETREALLDAVDALMAERGWNACTVSAVARRAGLTTGAVYSTFGSRGELLIAAVNRRSGPVTHLPPGDDLAEAVAGYARSYFATLDSPAGEQLVVAQLDLIRMSAGDPSLAAAFRDTYARMVDELASDFAAHAERLPAAPLQTAQRLLAALQGLTLQRVAFGADLDEAVFVAASLAAVGVPA